MELFAFAVLSFALGVFGSGDGRDVPQGTVTQRAVSVTTFRGSIGSGTFDAKSTARFYLRFGLFHQPNMRPILAMGNEMSKFYFWDLQKCEEGEDIAKKGKGGRKKTARFEARSRP